MNLLEMVPLVAERTVLVSWFEIIQLVTDIITSLTSVISLLVVVYVIRQFRADKKNKSMDYELDKRRSSVEIAKDYAKLISNELGVVLCIYEALEIGEIIDFIDFDKIEYFNTIEMNYLFENHKDELKTIKKKADVVKIPLKILVMGYMQAKYTQVEERNDLDKLLRYLSMSEKRKKALSLSKKEEFRNLEDRYSLELRVNFMRDWNFVMNTLEWMALAVNASVATEEILYDEMAPTFLRFCKWLYVEICESNGEYSRAYLNVAKLYKKWAGQMVKDDKKQRKEKKESANNGKVSYNSLEDCN